jgi:hypothetical protein
VHSCRIKEVNLTLTNRIFRTILPPLNPVTVDLFPGEVLRAVLIQEASSFGGPGFSPAIEVAIEFGLQPPEALGAEAQSEERVPTGELKLGPP